MEYPRHYSTAGWDCARSSSAPSINTMLSTVRRASDAPMSSFNQPQWRPPWEHQHQQHPQQHQQQLPNGSSDAAGPERQPAPVSPGDTKDARSQRLPSLRSILNPPSPVQSRPHQQQPSVGVPGDIQVGAAPPPRSSSPQFFRDDFANPAAAFRLSSARTDSVTAMSSGAPAITSDLPSHFHASHVQKPPQVPPISQLGPVQGVQRRLSNTPACAPGYPPDKLMPVSSMPSPDDQGDGMPRNSLKRRADATRGPPRLTKCIGQKDVPGEGLCWLYEDGSYCRTVIDGERVNPNWGVTKAGRPRKRLAQACLTCREKKIKCEPAYPKCHQCAKSQRICKGGMSQYMGLEAQATVVDTASLPRDAASSANPGASPVDRNSVHSATDQMTAAELGDSPKSAKRARTYSISSGRGYFDYAGSSNNAITPSSEIVDGLEREGHPLSLGWERDPYEVDPKHTLQLLDLYFTHIASATYCMFPKKRFLHWVQNCKNKSQDDRMLLYSVLALGSTFALDPMLRALGKHLAEIASHALEKRMGKFSLQLCQSRLMITLYQWAQGKAGETIAWDLSASAFRAISALSLNTEKGVRDFDDDDLTYWFDRPTLEECRRRTFWSGFLMDRYNGFCGGTMCVFNHDDIFLRLPCKESEYDRLDCVPPRPYFKYDSLLPTEGSSTPVSGAMAHLVLISAIWGEVFSTTARAVHRTDSPTYATAYREFHETASLRLQTWLTNLPAHLRYTTENLDASIANGYAGTFVSLHALFHTANIRLNRHVRPTILPDDVVSASIQAGRQHGHSLLSIMQDLSRSSRSARFSDSASGSQVVEEFTFSTPFPGYAFMNAVDVVSAGGLLASLPSLISLVTVGLSCVEELAEFWASGKAQLKALRTRVKLLGDVATGDRPEVVVQPPRSADGEKAWRLTTGLETGIDREDDTLYGTRSEEAFWEGVLNESPDRKSS